MTDEEAARKYADRVAYGDLSDKYLPSAPGNSYKDHECAFDAFLAGVKHGERKGWDAARKGAPVKGDTMYNRDTTFDYETFENWKKEQDK